MSPQNKSGDSKKFKILVVDDEPEITRLITDRLQREGYEVHAATTVMGAFQLAQMMRIELVVADVHMDGGGGLALVEFMRGRKDPPDFILITGQADFSAETAGQFGIKALLGKPIKFTLLLNIIRTLQRNRILQTALQAEPLPLERSSEPLFNPDDFKSMTISTVVKRLLTGATSPSESRLIEFAGETVVIEINRTEITAGEELECSVKTDGAELGHSSGNDTVPTKNEFITVRGRVQTVQDTQQGREILTLQLEGNNLTEMEKVQMIVDRRQKEILDFLKAAKGN